MRAALLFATGCVTSIHVARPAEVTTAAVPFSLVAQDGQAVTLAASLAKGAVVLVFYRGHW